MNLTKNSKILITAVIFIALLAAGYVYGIKNPSVSNIDKAEDKSEVVVLETDEVKEDTEQSAGEVDESVNTNIKLKLGETKAVKSLSIKAVRMVEDSRCPKDVQCIWAGRATVLFELVSGGTKKTEITLYSDVQGAIVFDGYSVKMINISPEKVSSNSIGTGEYLFTLNVQKN